MMSQIMDSYNMILSKFAAIINMHFSLCQNVMGRAAGNKCTAFLLQSYIIVKLNYLPSRETNKKRDINISKGFLFAHSVAYSQAIDITLKKMRVKLKPIQIFSLCKWKNHLIIRKLLLNWFSIMHLVSGQIF